MYWVKIVVSVGYQRIGFWEILFNLSSIVIARCFALFQIIFLILKSNHSLIVCISGHVINCSTLRWFFFDFNFFFRFSAPKTGSQAVGEISGSDWDLCKLVLDFGRDSVDTWHTADFLLGLTLEDQRPCRIVQCCLMQYSWSSRSKQKDCKVDLFR